MGWWKIDPATGKPLEDGQSKLSRPGEVVLLNAVPGVDDEEDAYYLGDGPWDMASTMPEELAGIVGDSFDWTPELLRRLFLKGKAPSGLSSKKADALEDSVDAFWDDIDSCYEDDWDRPSLPEEQKWICEDIVCRITEPLEDE